MVPVALAVEVGDLVLLGIARGLEPHLVHVALPAAAFLLFAGHALQDIRRNGRPRFSWRATPRASRRSRS